jgi:FixJ family two-component response regulator
MPGMSGLHLLEHLARKGDCRPVIMLTGHGEVATAVRAMQAGAVDFLQKPAAEDELVERIRRSLGIDAQWRHWHRQARGVLQRLNALTARQRQILDLIVDGLTTREIAGRLGESVETVEADRRTLLRRMAARSAVDLARMASLCRGVRGPTGRAA